MKNILNKSLIFIIIIFVLVNSFTALCYAEDNANFEFSTIESSTAKDSVKKPFEKAIGTVLDVIRVVGTGVSLIIIMYIGIKYLMAAPGERADMKKSSIQFVIGAAIVFGSSNLFATLVKTIQGIVE